MVLKKTLKSIEGRRKKFQVFKKLYFFRNFEEKFKISDVPSRILPGIIGIFIKKLMWSLENCSNRFKNSSNGSVILFLGGGNNQ